MGLEALPRFLTPEQRRDFNHQMRGTQRKEMRAALRDLQKARIEVMTLSRAPTIDMPALRAAMEAMHEARTNMAAISDGYVAQYLSGLTEAERQQIFTAMDAARQKHRRQPSP
jgi:uncharacterized membrane protein